jgi:hypothetical protein
MDFIFNALMAKYNKLTLTREEVSRELSISVSYLDKLVANDQLPIRYHRLGNSQRAKYAFSLKDVADYLNFVQHQAA